MPTNRYFALGDLLSNALCGLAAALLSLWCIDSGWMMFPAMVLGMLLGMIATMVLDFALLMRAFGAMEIMIPTMLSGMLAGMWVGMRAAMAPLTTLDASAYGVLSGIAVVALCWAANSALEGRQPNE